MSVSIVMTARNRERQMEATLESIRAQFELIVFEDNSPADVPYNNPARFINHAVRQAQNEIILLQNAECKHVDPETISKLCALVTPTNAVFARVIALNEDGSEGQVYCGVENPRPYFFCGAIRREWFEKLRGFDEDFKGYGWEDDDFADRLRREGVEFVFTDILVHHQWHPPAGDLGDKESGRFMFERKKSEPTVRNLNREWGAL